jgi:hypothetical protein
MVGADDEQAPNPVERGGDCGWRGTGNRKRNSGAQDEGTHAACGHGLLSAPAVFPGSISAIDRIRDFRGCLGPEEENATHDILQSGWPPPNSFGNCPISYTVRAPCPCGSLRGTLARHSSQKMTKDKAADFGIISFVSKWRATVNEDGRYSFAVPL